MRGKILHRTFFRMEVEAEFCVFINILNILARVDLASSETPRRKKVYMRLVEMLPVE